MFKFARVGAAAGIAFAVTLVATGAQAQNCTLEGSTNKFVNFAGAGFSPSAISGMISSTIVSASTSFLLQSTAFIGSPPNPQPDQQAGGIWVRGVGGEVSVKTSTNSSLTSLGSAPIASGTASTSCFQKVDEDFAGIQLGRDLGILNVNGWNLHWGVTAGYLATTGNLVGGAVSFLDPVTNVRGGGGPFTSTTNVPFIGAYAAATYGGFSVDALLRTEYYQNSLNAPGVNLFNQNIDAHGITFAASAAYQWQVPNSNWFIEPSAGVIISRVKVDSFNFTTAGSSLPFLIGGTAFIFDDRLIGTLQLNDIKSDIGRLGLRFGTTVDAGSVVWQPFAAVSVWHEFGPNVTSNFATCPGCYGLSTFGGFVPVTISSASSTTNIGTFGQYSLGVSVTAPGTGWLGFARVDFRDGPDLQGWSGTGGIRYQFAPQPGPAAITKTKAPPAPVVEAVNWTGFYIGGFGGATQGTADWDWGFGASVAPHIGGFLFGADAGYNYQFGNYVLGVEADLAGTDTKGGTACGPMSFNRETSLPPISPALPPGTLSSMFQMTCNAKTDWIVTAAARAGFTWDRALFFVKGGGAWTHEQFSATCNTASLADFPETNFPCTNPTGARSTGFSAGTTRTGWVLGFGTDFALTRNWFARAETDYISFGDTNVTASDGSALRVGMHVWEEKIGLNYRF
jgi:outer membrane autotransporter protein